MPPVELEDLESWDCNRSGIMLVNLIHVYHWDVKEMQRGWRRKKQIYKLSSL